ncbi:type II toxin-antitoxin system HicA family toxin [Massilia glaciei]|uniref:type II toxin-antitoxin system HicA family toxin n=1 Tax=Massilia glaciei TaxID=1524097 RepID=UPI0026BFFA98|nr:type II toxin-antitoxin system HicA family toxin [Massilia glaciei]
MKQSEFVRWLKLQGATFKDGTNHLKVYLNGRQSTLPIHPAKELRTGLVEAVKKQLDEARYAAGMLSGLTDPASDSECDLAPFPRV